jgi:hypothetical protein
MTSAQPSAIVAHNKTPRAQLRGPWLYVLRIAWMAYIVVTFIIPYARSLPAFYDAYRRACATEDCFFSPEAGAALTALGIPLDAYALLAVVLTAVVLLTTTALGFIVLWRSNDVMSLLTSAWIVSIISFVGVGTDETISITTGFPTWLDNVLGVAQSLGQFILLYAMLCLFPSGRFVPRWSWVLLAIPPLIVFGSEQWTWLILPFTSSLLIAIGCQVYRYRRVSIAIERQQTKWVVLGFALFLIANQLFWIPVGFTNLGQTLYLPAAWLLYLLAALFLPLSFFLAIQRYGLFEIDRLINRALVYGALTAILVGVYIGVVIGLQSVFRATTGQESPIAVVASTLVIAGLFQTLRGFLQRSIDQRFYRAKYDAQKTLTAFSATLRQEVSLTELREHLLEVVEQTMRPAHVSLWLAPPPTTASHTLAPPAPSEERHAR